MQQPLRLQRWLEELPAKFMQPGRPDKARQRMLKIAIGPADSAEASLLTARASKAGLMTPTVSPLKSLAVALSLMQEFGRSTQPLSVGELARRHGLSKSHCSKLLATMRSAGFLEQDIATRRYSVGIGAFALGIQYVRHHELARLALPTMRRVAEACDCSTTLSVLQGVDVIHIQIVEGRLTLEGRLRIGVWIPFHASSAGRVILSRHPEQEVARLVAQRQLQRFTSATVTDLPKLLTALRQVKLRGYALTRNQTRDGSAALAVPVFDAEQQICASLGVLLPEHLAADASALAMLDTLRDAARDLSLRNGAVSYPYR